jgi:hypothetical protein
VLGDGEEHGLLRAWVEHDVQLGGDVSVMQAEPASHAWTETEVRGIEVQYAAVRH